MLQSLTGQTFAVSGVETPPEVEVTLPALKGTKLQLRVAFRPRERPGWREGKIKFRISGLKRKEVALPYNAMVEGVVDTDPNFLNFGLVEPNQVKRLTFRIVNRSENQVRLQLKSKPKFVICGS